jgi:hypothetical protein
MEMWTEEHDELEVEVPNYEGVRVNFEIDGIKGWFLLRKSLHDPEMPLTIMTAEKGGIRKVLPMIGEFLGRYEGIRMPEQK